MYGLWSICSMRLTMYSESICYDRSKKFALCVEIRPLNIILKTKKTFIVADNVKYNQVELNIAVSRDTNYNNYRVSSDFVLCDINDSCKLFFPWCTIASSHIGINFLATILSVRLLFVCKIEFHWKTPIAIPGGGEGVLFAKYTRLCDQWVIRRITVLSKK